jgi:hypothetical protein
VRVAMGLVGMGADDESVPPLREAHGKLVPDAVGFLPCMLSRVFSEISQI